MEDLHDSEDNVATRLARLPDCLVCFTPVFRSFGAEFFKEMRRLFQADLGDRPVWVVGPAPLLAMPLRRAAVLAFEAAVEEWDTIFRNYTRVCCLLCVHFALPSLCSLFCGCTQLPASPDEMRAIPAAHQAAIDRLFGVYEVRTAWKAVRRAHSQENIDLMKRCLYWVHRVEFGHCACSCCG
jgi:hypothetical protein